MNVNNKKNIKSLNKIVKTLKNKWNNIQELIKN